MNEDKVIALKNPGIPTPMADALTALLREGTQRMLASAIEAEISAFLERFKDEKTGDGRQRMVRNGHLPEGAIQTGVGPVEISLPNSHLRLPTRLRLSRSTRPITP